MTTRSDWDADVLVVGAGPTGLALALQAHDHGARVRIVERRSEPFRPSRALMVHPRTLEVLRPLGVTDALLACAERDPLVHAYLGRHVVPVRLADLSLTDAAFPHLVLVRQADVEAVLTRALDDRGVDVERGTELVGYEPGDDGVTAALRRDGESWRLVCRYLGACDGSDSAVRSDAGVEWRGRRYRHDVLLADLDLGNDLAPGIAHAVVGRSGLLFLFPEGETAPWRLLATERAMRSDAAFGHPGTPVPQGVLQELLDASGLHVRVREVVWSARVRLQHRVAARYRVGSVFLAGDAAHTSSPAGGQGMNVGIQDAMNLGWKLAFAAGSPSGTGDRLLDSYETERRPVARGVLALTNAMFWAEAGTDRLAAALRGALAPLAAPLVPTLLRQRWLVTQGVRVLAQMRWHYRRSPLSVEGTPPTRCGAVPGDRLPDEDVVTATGPCRLHDLTASPGVHLLLQRHADDPGLLPNDVSAHRLLSWPGRGVVIVRPDGHVGYRSGAVDPRVIAAWLNRLGLRTGTAVGADQGTESEMEVPPLTDNR